MPAKKIVLSPDSVLLSILENSFFQREGFELVQINDGQTGYECVEREAPILAVFDLAQLGEQGLECCLALKKDTLLSTTPVLLLLPERPDGELADKCWVSGCDAVVHRPLAAERFLAAACGLLGISMRLARRFPVNFRLDFQDSSRKTHSGICVNLNDGGMFLATEALFPVDSILQVEFSLPGFGGAFKCAARVSWVNHPEWRKKNAMPCGMGFQLEDIDQTLVQAIREYLDSLS